VEIVDGEIKMKFINRHKEGITRLIGIIVIAVTLLSIYHGQITFWFEGLVGMSFGILLLWIPQKVVKLILAIIERVTDKLLSKEEEEAG
jgi:hypothetical protein